jgi:hypothetical protein
MTNTIPQSWAEKSVASFRCGQYSRKAGRTPSEITHVFSRGEFSRMAATRSDEGGITLPLPALWSGQAFRRLPYARTRLLGLWPGLQFRRSGGRPGLLCHLFRLRPIGSVCRLAGGSIHRIGLGAPLRQRTRDHSQLLGAPPSFEGVAGRKPVFSQSGTRKADRLKVGLKYSAVQETAPSDRAIAKWRRS